MHYATLFQNYCSDFRVGQMSINQAAIHYNLPYSSLYGRFKRGKYENDALATAMQPDGSPHIMPPDGNSQNSMHSNDHHQQMMHYVPVQQMNNQQHPQHMETQQYVQHGSIS